MLLASTTAWYAARAGGMVAFALLSVGVLLGLGLSGRARLKDWPRFALEDVHRFVGLLAGTFVAVHVLVLLLQGFVPFSVADLVIPFAASFKPLPTALGVVSMCYWTPARRAKTRIVDSSHGQVPGPPRRTSRSGCSRSRTGSRRGTDTGTVWGAATYAVAGGAVAGLTAWRVASRRALEPWALRLWPGTAALVTAELLVAVSLVR